MGIFVTVKSRLDGIGWGDNSIKKIVQAGLRAAQSAQHRQHRMGAVVVQGRKIISVGRNLCKTHSRSKGPYQQVHAETHALSQAGTAAFGGTLVVVRRKADGSLGISKPCKSCVEAATKAGIRRIIYANNEGSLVSEDLRAS